MFKSISRGGKLMPDEEMQQKVEDYKKRKDKLYLGGGKDRIDKQHKQKK